MPFLFFGLLFLVSSCSPPATKSSVPIKISKEKKLKELWIMTYNVENLFDTKDDPSKNDETYLPIKIKRQNKNIQQKCKKAGKKHWVQECLTTNWNDYKLNLKMKRLAQVISSFNKKKGPDLLILQEVENLEILQLLKNKYLSNLNYKEALLIESPDRRGIDVGILSRLSLDGKAKAHLQDYNSTKPTRNILEATFSLNEKKLTLLGLHFPSQGSPSKFRKQAALKLNSLLKSIPQDHLVISGGDFNITSSEETENKYFSQLLSSSWSVSHIVGCKNCRGTHYYHRKRSWSFLDALLFSKNLSDNKGWELDPESIFVFNNLKIQNNRYGSPARFNDGQHASGVSDHWPLAARIYLKP